MFIVERNREMSSLCLCKSPDRLGMYTCFIIFPKARAAWALKILNFNARLMGSVWRNSTWIAFHLPIRKKSDSLMFDEWLRTILPRRRFCRIRMCAIHFVWKLVSDQSRAARPFLSRCSQKKIKLETHAAHRTRVSKPVDSIDIMAPQAVQIWKELDERVMRLISCHEKLSLGFLNKHRSHPLKDQKEQWSHHFFCAAPVADLSLSHHNSQYINLWKIILLTICGWGTTSPMTRWLLNH